MWRTARRPPGRQVRSEARGPEGLFGQERLVSLLQDLPGGDPGLVVGRIREEVAAYQRGPQADDLAVLALRLTG
ncbi:SpoIIE family protein phosphatase [Micromonospora sp. NPDC049497]|uniref:SpoIIE family protein phosphatase n=1 Tax=Micromonospora sp. NPDC049497 TaxID=3364273 RepID=UPI00379F09B5